MKKNIHYASWSFFIHVLTLVPALFFLFTNNAFKIPGGSRVIEAHLVSSRFFVAHQDEKVTAQKGIVLAAHEKQSRLFSKQAAMQPENKMISGAELNKLVLLIYYAIDAHKTYPSEAASQGESGQAIVEFTLFPNGNVSSIHLVKSSGFNVLDQAALSSVQASQPISNVNQLIKSPQQITIPVSYAVER